MRKYWPELNVDRSQLLIAPPEQNVAHPEANLTDGMYSLPPLWKQPMPVAGRKVNSPPVHSEQEPN